MKTLGHSQIRAVALVGPPPLRTLTEQLDRHDEYDLDFEERVRRPASPGWGRNGDGRRRGRECPMSRRVRSISAGTRSIFPYAPIIAGWTRERSRPVTLRWSHQTNSLAFVDIPCPKLLRVWA